MVEVLARLSSVTLEGIGSGNLAKALGLTLRIISQNKDQSTSSVKRSIVVRIVTRVFGKR